MSQAQDPKKRSKTPASKEDRLKAALKANMARRKAQSRARSAQTDTKGQTGHDEESR